MHEKKNYEEYLKKHFGLASFRENQLPIVISTLKGVDTLAILPTGGGKSLTFQFPVKYAGWKGVVITPLIALMEDQVYHLRKHQYNAYYLHSGVETQEAKVILSEYENAPYGLLYCSPEKLLNDHFLGEISQINVRLIVVDEAHCISQWGNTFRPAYRNIKYLKSFFPKANILGVTATATSKVIEDIVENLELIDPNIIVASAQRKNIGVFVERYNAPVNQLSSMVQSFKQHTIIYVRNRLKTVAIAEFLSTLISNVYHYHGGMPLQERHESMKAWVNNENAIMVATNAFGMGVDCSTVRQVIHLDIPSSTEEYFQEIGRAGRDGNYSKALMMIQHGEENKSLKKFKRFNLDKEDLNILVQTIKQLFKTKFQSKIPFILSAIAHQTKIHPIRLNDGLALFEKYDLIKRSPGIINPVKVKFEVGSSKERIFHKVESFHFKVADLLLKMYENLYDKKVVIHLNKVAYELNVDRKKIHEALLKLANEGILVYDEGGGEEYVLVKESFYNFKDWKILLLNHQEQLNKLKGMHEYLESSMCRMQALMKYFNQETKPCLICDNCAKETNKFSGDVMELMILNLLSKRKIPTRELLEKLPGNKKEAIVLLGKMENEGQIQIKSGYCSLVL